MVNKLVSVVIPAYNASLYIRDAIESVLAQTYCDYEIIVVDDGSTDDTPVIVKQFGNKVRYIHQSNQGLSAARNTAIRIAYGNAIALLDADDLWEPGFLEKMANHLYSHPQAAAVYCGFHYIDSNGQKIGRSSLKVVPHEKFYEKLISEGNWLVPCSVVFRKEPAEEVGLFDEEIGPVADTDLWLKLSAKYSFLGLPEALVNYRRHDSNMSKDPDQMIVASYRQTVKMFGQLDGNPSLWSEKKLQAYINLFISGAGQYLAYGALDKSAQYFQKLIAVSPKSGLSMSVWRKMARAHLPQEYNFPDTQIDSKKAERDILGLLDELSQRVSSDDLQKVYPRIKGSAFLAMADEAGRAGELHLAVRWLWMVARACPRLLLIRSYWGTVIRSFLGYKPTIEFGESWIEN